MHHPGHILITGAGGTIGSILLPALSREARVVGLDIDAASDQTRIIRAHATDREVLREHLEADGMVIHLATGVHRGWEGLVEVDLLGTKLLLDEAAEAGAARVLLASSHHVAGGFESDYFSRGVAPGLGTVPAEALVGPADAVRPDGDYGAVKAFAEAYGRFIAETTATAVSCLRIGTVTPVDDPDAYASFPQFSHIPEGLDGVRRRLRATWLHHEDLVRIVDEELSASNRFRLRFAVSDNPGRFWSLDVHSWDGQ